MTLPANGTNVEKRARGPARMKAPSPNERARMPPEPEILGSNPSGPARTFHPFPYFQNVFKSPLPAFTVEIHVAHDPGE